MEQARLFGYYATMVHSPKRLKISDFGLFSWEDEQDYAPKFAPVDREAFERFNAIKFPNQDN